jgi:outer membrane lipoprotein-sorting protein
MCDQISLRLVLLSVFAFLHFGKAFAVEPTLSPDEVKKILDYSDRTRGGVKEGLVWDVTLKSWDDGNESEREFIVKNKANDSYVESKKPARYKGEVYIFNTRTMWFYKPDLSKPVAISTRQKLSGAASNGDIASTAYARDYTGKLVKIEKLGEEECYLLHLKSKAKDTTYDQINYWISKKSGLGLKSEFLSLKGKPIKLATFVYQNKIKENGKEFPFVSEMNIIDAKNAKNKSSLIYKNPVAEPQPDSLFNINNLLR